MSLFSYAYNRYLSSRGLGRRIWDRILRLMLAVTGGDAECQMMVHGFSLSMPLSHQLPVYLRNYPLYDSLPGRISRFVASHYGHVTCIDVGANIGDTIAAFKTPHENRVPERFLAIEPNPTYRKYLEQNWGSDPSVTILSCLCSSEDGTAPADIFAKNGTASITIGSSNPEIDDNVFQIRTIDSLIKEHSQETGFNVLKIDTDGHDCEVLAGSAELLERELPFVLFELDNFNDDNFIDKIINTIKLLQKAGYKRYLLYDNLGYLIGKFELSDVSTLYNLIFYKLTSPFCFFDVLCIQERYMDLFYEGETEICINNPEITASDRLAAKCLAEKLQMPGKPV